MIEADARYRLVIVGGGFTGAVLAIHALRATTHALDITIVEPAADLGRGIAYGTNDPNHRINVPSDRMDLSAATPLDATRWFFEKAIIPDVESDDGQGQFYVPRAAYGAYVADCLREASAGAWPRAVLRHLRATAVSVTEGSRTAPWRVACDDGTLLAADVVALCFGHSTPSGPCPIAPAVGAHPKFVSDPWARNALAAIEPRDRVMIVGTGLTMADVAMSLRSRGHVGPVVAVSRRGLLPLGHGAFLKDLDILRDAAPPRTAIDLLRLVRRRVDELAPTFGWQPVVDSLRVILPDVWNALPAREKREVVRRLLPFWEIHRFRIAPRIDAALRLARSDGSLIIEKAAVADIAIDEGGFTCRLRRADGAFAEHDSDAVVLCTGPDRDLRNNPLIAAILAEGLGRIDDAGLGLAVDRSSRIIDAAGGAHPGLLAFGPMTRGSFGEMTGAADIASHVERVVGELLGVPFDAARSSSRSISAPSAAETLAWLSRYWVAPPRKYCRARLCV